MPDIDAAIDRVRQHVREAHEHVRRQRAISKRLARAGGHVELSDELMVVFVEHLHDMRRYLRRIQKI